MSAMAKEARAKMKAKAARMGAADPHRKVDASSWEPEEALNAEAKTGLRPISRRAFKRGGLVAEGEAKKHAGRKSRKATGGGLRANQQEKALRKYGVAGKDESTDTFRERRAAGRSAKAAPAFMQSEYGVQMPEKFRESRELLRRAAYKRKDGGSVVEYLGDAKKSNAELGKPHIGGYASGGDVHLDRTMSGKGRTAKVYRSKDGEYLVRHFEGGEHVPDMDRHTEDRTEAHGIADAFARGRHGGLKNGGRAHRLYGGGFEAKRGTSLPYMNKGGAAHGADCSCKKCASGGGTKWIQGATENKGSLHRSLGIAQDKKIPEKKLEKAEHSKNPHLRKKAQLAETLKGLRRANGGKADEGLRPVSEALKKVMAKVPPPKPEKRASGGKINDGGNGARPSGGRMARKSGGRTKGATKVNIVIATGGQPGQPPMGMPPRPPMMPSPMPMAPPPGMPPAMGAPIPQGGPPMGAPPMMRKRGGGVLEGRQYRSYRDMDAGSLGGKGRLEKAEIQKHKD